MEIFNIHLGESDAKEFCRQSESFKIDWIKKNTNQQNETIIKEFLSGPIKKGKCGCGCGDKIAMITEKTKVYPVEKVIAPKAFEKKKID